MSIQKTLNRLGEFHIRWEGKKMMLKGSEREVEDERKMWVGDRGGFGKEGKGIRG